MSILTADAYWKGCREWGRDCPISEEYGAEEREAYAQGQEDGFCAWETLLVSQER